MKINIRHDLNPLIRSLDLRRDQVPYATARALTKTAQAVRLDVMAELPKVFDRPVPFTMGAIGYLAASKTSLESSVFIRDAQAAYLRKQIEGRTELPKGRALVEPVNVDLNQYGNMPRNKVRQLLARKNVFSGSVNGIAGIWQRVGRRQLKLLVKFEAKREVSRRFDFFGIVKTSIGKHLLDQMRESIAAAMRTAR